MARLDGDKVKLTPVQARLWEALQDGEPHDDAELKALVDEQCDLNHLQAQMSYLRTKVRQMGDETVVREDGCYRKVAYVKHIP